MADTTVSITNEDLGTALGNFLVSILPDGVQIIIGQVNRTASPPANYVVMTLMRLDRLSTNVTKYTRDIDPGDGTRESTQHIDSVWQLDVHGDQSADNATIISTFFRDAVGCEHFAASGFEIAPLYTSDPRQVPFITGEDQFEDRWTIDAHLQFNPTVSRAQQFAKTLGPIGLIPVEVFYPAGDEQT